MKREMNRWDADSVAKHRVQATRCFQVGEVEKGITQHLDPIKSMYESHGWLDKAAEILEEAARHLLGAGDNEHAAAWYRFASGDWRRNGDALAEEGKKAEALEAYHKALAACERAMALDPRRSPTGKFLIEMAIRDLQ